MTFQQLQYLLAVNRNGSFSLAAKEMFISQSAVSSAVAALEQELGCRIFIRSTQGLSLTPEGQQVLGYAQRICENHHSLTTSIKPSTPQCRISAIEYAPARRAFLQLLSENQHRRDISFAYTRISGFENRLLRGETDLAINLSFSQYDSKTVEKAKKQQLSVQKLATIPACICISDKHRLFEKPDLKPEDFAGERLLDIGGKIISGIGLLMAYVPVDQNYVIECNQTRMAQQLREEGYVYAITHMRDVRSREENTRYIPIPGLSYSLFVYNDPLRPLSPELSRYLELLQEEISPTAP
jgi:DNA-binding transcriptional LysR family regulator